MANEYEYEAGGGAGFMMGLLTGTVLGAGIGMLFAPKSGSELRGQLSETATKVSNKASESYHKVADRAGEFADKSREMGRDVAGKAREAVSRGQEEARRFSEQTGSSSNVPGGSTGSSGSSGSFGSGSSSPSSPYSSGPDRDRIKSARRWGRRKACPTLAACGSLGARSG